MSSESDSELEWEYKSPDEGLEMEELSNDEDDDDEGAAGRWSSGEAAQFLDDLLIRVLFKTPSGFAIFLYDGFKLRQPNALKEIWADFVDLWRRLVLCINSKPFENKAHAISQSTGVSEEFAAMIRGCLKPGQKLAVGNEDYKSIIEKELHIPCVYDSAIEELMWGLKIQMQSLLTPENSDLTYEDCFPMGTGIYCFLKGHKFDVKPDMIVTRQIVELAGIMYDYDHSIETRRNSLRSVAECIKKISRIDTKDWDLLKIAIALKIICCPQDNVAVPKGMFSKRHLEKFKSDAPLYTMFLKTSSLALHDEVYYAWKFRSKVGRDLTRLIQLANKVDVEQPHEAAIDQDDLDGKKIYPDINPAILDELNEYGTVASACRLDRPVPPTPARVDEHERYTHISSHPLHIMNKPGILSMDIHPLKDIVATGGMDTNAVLFDRLSGQILCTLTGHSKEITSLKFVNRDELIVTGSADKTVRIWQGSKDGHYSCIHTLKDHAAEVEAVTVHATQKYFVTASKDNSWCFYDTSTGSCLTKVGVEASGQEGYTSASFHPDGLVLGTGTTDGFVKIWDVKTQSKVAKLEGHVGPVTDMSFSENGYFLATAALDGVRLWDIRKLTRDFSTIFPGTPTNAVEFDSSGFYLAVGGSDIRVCQVANAMVECNVIRALPDLSGTGKVTSVKFGTDATYIAVGSMHRNLRIFGLQSCQPSTQDKTVFC